MKQPDPATMRENLCLQLKTTRNDINQANLQGKAAHKDLTHAPKLKDTANQNMKLIQARFRIVLLLTLFLAGCKTLTSEQHATIPNQDIQYSFNKPPFINPRIIQDLSTWISDGGDQVVAINLLNSQDSNRYFGETGVKEIDGQNPYIFVSATNLLGSETYLTEFGYQLVGKTSSDVYVLKTVDCEGGSGTFMSLVLVTFEYDQGIDCDWGKGVVGFKGKRLLIKKLGEVALGNRWDGKLAIEGNSVVMGRDAGQFRYNTNSIVLKCDLGR